MGVWVIVAVLIVCAMGELMVNKLAPLDAYIVNRPMFERKTFYIFIHYTPVLFAIFSMAFLIGCFLRNAVSAGVFSLLAWFTVLSLPYTKEDLEWMSFKYVRLQLVEGNAGPYLIHASLMIVIACLCAFTAWLVIRKNVYAPVSD